MTPAKGKRGKKDTLDTDAAAADESPSQIASDFKKPLKRATTKKSTKSCEEDNSETCNLDQTTEGTHAKVRTSHRKRDKRQVESTDNPVPRRLTRQTKHLAQTTDDQELKIDDETPKTSTKRGRKPRRKVVNVELDATRNTPVLEASGTKRRKSSLPKETSDSDDNVHDKVTVESSGKELESSARKTSLRKSDKIDNTGENVDTRELAKSQRNSKRLSGSKDVEQTIDLKTPPMSESSPIVTPVTTPSKSRFSERGAQSPRRSRSTGEKRSPVTDSGTPLRPVDRASNRSLKKSAVKVILSAKKFSAADEKEKDATTPLMSSTPRGRIKRSLNLTQKPTTPEPMEMTVKSPQQNKEQQQVNLNDISEPMLSDNEELLNMSDFYDSKTSDTMNHSNCGTATKAQQKTLNETFDVDESKSVLKKTSAKRSSDEANLSNLSEQQSAKRSCRVRFATLNPESNEQVAASLVASVKKIATPCIKKTRLTSSTPYNEPIKPTFDESSIHKANSMVEKSNNAVTVGSLKKPSIAFARNATPANKGLASRLKTPGISAKKKDDALNNSTRLSLSAQNASANRLSKPKFGAEMHFPKSASKTSTAKKAPNFALIHERKFAKLESLVDAKKRLERRHVALSGTSTTRVSKIPSKAVKSLNLNPKPKKSIEQPNGEYNRFGFKIRKNDAVSMMMNKQPFRNRSSNKKELEKKENKLVLQGVRMNRRFELQMKAKKN